QDAHRRRPAAPDRRGARRDRLLAAGGLGIAAAQRIYARALFEAARDRGRLEAVRDELADLVRALDEVPELSALLDNPETDTSVKADVLERVLGGGEELLRNFARLVAEKGRAGELREIAREFESLVAAQEQVIDVELTTARSLSDEEFGRLVGRIEQA